MALVQPQYKSMYYCTNIGLLVRVCVLKLNIFHVLHSCQRHETETCAKSNREQVANTGLAWPTTFPIVHVYLFKSNTINDRLSQMPDPSHKSQQADNFCNGMGILQQVSPATKFPPDRTMAITQQPTSQSQEQPNYTLMFATMIARTAKDIDHLIEILPSEESSTELQLASLRRLEQENVEATATLKEAIGRGERLLERVQGALVDISKSQMEMDKNDHFFSTL